MSSRYQVAYLCYFFSIALYLTSLMMPIMTIFGHTPYHGWEALLQGWVTLGDGNPAWCANLAYAALLVGFWHTRVRVALLLAVVTFGLGLCAFIGDPGWLIGAYVWQGAFVFAFIAAFQRAKSVTPATKALAAVL